MLVAMSELRARSVAKRIEQDMLFDDSAIVSAGFAPERIRDYDVIIDVPGALPDLPENRVVGNLVGSFIAGRYRYRFTHCVTAIAQTALGPVAWRQSWSDLFTDREAWERAGSPDGFVWDFVETYPGMSYVKKSRRAKDWTKQLGHDMHEVRIEANLVVIELVFHDLLVDQLAVGDPATRTLRPLED
jgi:hypothetical protein